MSKSISFEEQYRMDVERMLRCAQDAGYIAAESDLIRAWTEYSESTCATWLMLPEENDALLSILLKHIESTNASRGGSIKFTTTVVDAGDGTGDGMIEIPDELLAALGWHEGDVLNVKVREPSVLVLERLDEKKGAQTE
ncbi:hypothetical protein ACO0K0_19950 [Undibacterium sp. SXout11W]|uniref:hypothetical protein n=1 Tax=Undibacterium sp. SXout11W TaxID=3413050 RepID=UPI003BF116EF